jgi:hypothetical protein
MGYVGTSSKLEVREKPQTPHWLLLSLLAGTVFGMLGMIWLAGCFLRRLLFTQRLPKNFIKSSRSVCPPLTGSAVLLVMTRDVFPCLPPLKCSKYTRGEGGI